MKIGLIDVGEWQTTIDLQNGRPIDVSHPNIAIAEDLLAKHPYPGDFDPNASRWVTDVALEAVDRYDPSFVMLVYAKPYFSAVYAPTSEAERKDLIREVFGEVDRFTSMTGFTPVIVGLGDLTPVIGNINLINLDGLALAGGMSSRYAGLYEASESDLAYLKEQPGIERIVSKESFQLEFGGVPAFYRRFPDYLLVAKEGQMFHGLGSSPRSLHRIPTFDQTIPLHTGLGKADSLTSISDLVLSGLNARQKIALVVVEGVGCDLFPLSFQRVSNSLNWYCYAPGEGQYLALTTGKHIIEGAYPPGHPHYAEDNETKPFPFSGSFNEMPDGTIAQRYSGRSFCVGSRGILTHIVAGADITVECFARGLYNHGTLAALEID